jgi:exo-beta-1,3-glucanase (GH17 family)
MTKTLFSNAPARRARSGGPLSWLTMLLLSVSVLLSSCGGGGEVPFPQPGGLRPLSADFTTRKAINYSPFRTDNRDTEVVTRENLLEDLGLLAQGGFTLLRTFDSSDAVARQLLEIIRDNRLNIKVQLGIFIATTTTTGDQLEANLAFNSAEVARGIALANEFPSIVIAVSVGNETLAFGRSTPAEMAEYLAQVRGSIQQPLTTNDVWDAFAPGPGTPGMSANVINLLDYVSMHTYPILYATPNYYNPWDYEQQDVPEAQRAAAMMDAAVQVVKDNHAAVRKHLEGLGLFTLPIVIGESGWKAVATSDALTYLAHPVNQKMYLDRMNAWVEAERQTGGPLAFFYFEAFDEPWKATANPNFNDDNWGLFNVERQARCAIQSLYPQSQWADGDCSLSEAVFFPTVISQEITADRYTIYADLPTEGEQVVTPSIPFPPDLVNGRGWFGFDNPPNAFAGEGEDATFAFEGPHYVEVATCDPASTCGGPDAYGWGMLATNSTRVDLNQFGASGRLNFSIKTTYPGKLMFGFDTTATGAVFVVADNNNADGYGYVNDGQWHQVSIPIADFVAAGGVFDLTKVTSAFIIADIYDRTGNTARGDTTKVFIDAVFWSK